VPSLRWNPTIISLEDRIHLEMGQRNKAEEEKEFADMAEKRGTSTGK
jgi:hypothetical protein